MAVAIKGMKMPTSCYDCNCFIRDSDGSDYCCLLMQDIEDNDKRDDNCPLVPVPPHGRLIDADAMTNRGERMQLSYWADKLGLPYHTLYDRLYRLGWPIEKALTTPVRRSA